MLNDSPRPMPNALRQRLRDIPKQEVLCRDVERLYRAARTRAFAGTAEVAIDAPAERHLEACPSCRQLYATLASAFNLRPLPLPHRLARGLRAITRHPERLLPIWIADTRYAAAACYLLAALALSLAGEASALFRDTSATVSSKAQVWVDESEARGNEAWKATTATFSRGVDDGWHTATRYGVACEKFFTSVFKAVETTTRELIPGRERPVEGDPDGRSGKE